MPHHGHKQRRARKKTKLTSAQKTTYTIVSIVLIVIAIGSLSLAFSSVLAQGPHNLLNEWENEKRMGSELEWESALSILETAQILNPLDAQIPFDIGRLYHWKGRQYKVWEQPFKDNMKIAENYYIAALKHRPTWGLAWIYLSEVMIKNQRARFGGIEAYKQAMKYDPYGYAASTGVVYLLPFVWTFLDDANQCMALNIVSYRYRYKNHGLSSDFELDNLHKNIPVTMLHPEVIKQQAKHIKNRSIALSNSDVFDKYRLLQDPLTCDAQQL